MTADAYQKQPGDFEIRFLKDGRVVFVGPDQTLLDLAQAMELIPDASSDQERNTHEPDPTTPIQTDELGHDGTGGVDSGPVPPDLRG